MHIEITDKEAHKSEIEALTSWFKDQHQKYVNAMIEIQVKYGYPRDAVEAYAKNGSDPVHISDYDIFKSQSEAVRAFGFGGDDPDWTLNRFHRCFALGDKYFFVSKKSYY